MTRTFDPWIGPLYESEGLDGLKLLILGESHYGPHGSEHADKTKQVVARHVSEKRYRLLTTTSKMTLGRGGRGRLSHSDRTAFWDRVAFANYIQAFVGESAEARERTAKMWEDARGPFEQNLRELRPDALLVLGLGVSEHLPALPAGLTAACIEHPSRYPNYAASQPIVQKLIADARAAASLPSAL